MSFKAIRINDIDLVPKELIRGIKERSWELKDFLPYMRLIQDSPTILIYVIVDEETHTIKGFFWGTVDLLANTLSIQNLSVDKSLWHRGEMFEWTAQYVKELAKDLKLKKCYWSTERPALYKKFGYNEAKFITMEYEV